MNERFGCSMTADEVVPYFALDRPIEREFEITTNVLHVST